MAWPAFEGTALNLLFLGHWCWGPIHGGGWDPGMFQGRFWQYCSGLNPVAPDQGAMPGWHSPGSGRKNKELTGRPVILLSILW